MRSSDCDILIVPGYQNSGPGHWQTRWERKLSTARRVEQRDWEKPRREPWVQSIMDTVAACRRPVVLVAHSLGVVAVAHAGPHLAKSGVRGAFLVAPPDVEAQNAIPVLAREFAPTPRDPLPFPSLLVASRTDPHCTFGQAEDLAYAWGSALVDAGDSGHINTESGHGPWPEGLMRFAAFLSRL